MGGSSKLRERARATWAVAAVGLVGLVGCEGGDDGGGGADASGGAGTDASALDFATPDAAGPDAARPPVCETTGRLDLRFEVELAGPEASVPGQGLCHNNGFHEFDGRARVETAAAGRVVLRFLDGEPGRTATLAGTFSRVALDVGAEIEARVACLGASEIGTHAAAALTDAAGPILLAEVADPLYLWADRASVAPANFFGPTPITRAARCSVADDEGCLRTEDELTFALGEVTATLAAGEDVTLTTTGAPMRIRVAEARTVADGAGVCFFAGQSLAFEVTRTRSFDGPPATCPAASPAPDAPPPVNVESEPHLPEQGLFQSFEQGTVVLAEAGHLEIDSLLGGDVEVPLQARINLTGPFPDFGLRPGDDAMVSLSRWASDDSGGRPGHLLAVADRTGYLLVQTDTGWHDAEHWGPALGSALALTPGDACVSGGGEACRADHRLLLLGEDGPVGGMPGEAVEGRFFGVPLQVTIRRAESVADATGCPSRRDAPDGRVELFMVRRP